MAQPILERIIDHETSLRHAARCALVSLDSTIRSNLSVGLPIDRVIVRDPELRVGHKIRIDKDTPLFPKIRLIWAQKPTDVLHCLPPFPREMNS